METARYYFDVISPYAYLAWFRLKALRARRDLEVEPVPILFAALLDAHGHKGPAEIPPKRVYTWKNVVRIAAELGVRIEPPPAHPFNPLLALRIIALPAEATTRARAIDALFLAAWGGGGGVTDPAHVAALLDAADLDGQALVEAAGTPEAKAQVRARTDEAIAAGVFGVPTFLVGDELFWGQDSLPHLEAYLDGRDPAAAAQIERWIDLPVGVTRTQRG